MPSLRLSLKALAMLAAAGFTQLAVAHPGESEEAVAAEMAKRDAFMQTQTHLRKRCASHFQKRGHETRAAERRRALVEQIREERGLPTGGEFIQSQVQCLFWGGGSFELARMIANKRCCTVPNYGKRDLTTVLDTDHNETLVDPDVSLSTSQDVVFGDNTSCILWPSIEPLAEGPYCM